MGKDNSNLGNAITAIGLEDRFLSNGYLASFPLIERGLIANGIIAEKLRLGRWQGVIRMMHGGFGKADALYEGDRDELREDIIRSATENTLTRFKQETIETLVKAGENDLLFKLATGIPSLDYENFDMITRNINPDYFNDAEEGDQRTQTLHQTLADKAMSERKYDSAFYHFSKADDNEGIGNLFDTILDTEREDYFRDLLEKIAFSDSTQVDERLKRMDRGLKRLVLSSISGEEDVPSPLVAFQLSKKHNIVLSPEEEKALQKRAAESAGRYDLEQIFSQNPEARLLWAKKHAGDEPKTAYNIFTQQEFDGTQVITAVRSGLSLESYQNKDRALEISDVSKPHLRRVYSSTSFDVKVGIASYLQDSKKLQELSRQAHKKGDLGGAYHLWVNGGGDLDGDYIGGIRTALIKDDLGDSFRSMSFLDSSDTKGMVEAYDTLMKTRKGERKDNLGHAYGLALNLGDEDRIQRTREAMVTISPNWAIRSFKNQTGGGDDSRGLDYVLGIIASEYNVDQKELRRLVDGS